MDTAPVARRTRSQNVNIDRVITPDQAASLGVFAVCERVRLATGAVSMFGRWDLVRRAMGSSRLLGIGLSGGFGMTNLGSGAGGLE